MKYMSLFSGIGGFEVGIENSSKDLECVCCSEIDKYAINIYKKHFPNHNNLGDITQIDASNLPDFDLLVGGFPCQAFSIAGKMEGFDDTRGTLFFDIARILKEKKPKYFLLENVRNLLSHDKGRTFSVMMQILINLGYNIRWDVLNSKDFGVPQSRERIYIRGSLNDFPNDISICENGLGQPNRIKCLVRGKYQHEKIFSPDGLNQTLAATGGNSGGSTIIRESKIQKIGNHSASGRGQGGNVYDDGGLSPTLTCQHDYPAKVRIKKVYGSMQKNRAENNGEHSPTLTAMSANITNRPIIETNYAYRAITPIECERLQGFEDDWTAEGFDGAKISNTQRYKCLGNAVTTKVIQYIIDNWEIK